MSSRMSTKMSLSKKDTVSGWDAAITDAERKIQKAEITIARLRQGILAFRKMRDRKEPFPDAESKESA